VVTNVAMAAKTSDPNMNDEVVKSAPDMVKDLTNQITGVQPAKPVGATAAGDGSQGLGLEVVPNGTGTPGANAKAPSSESSEGKEGTPPPQAPAQVNEIQKPTGEGVDVTQAGSNTPETAGKVDKKKESSSKKKKKKGLGKLNPF